MQIVREHYLRDDIWCGSVSCIQCGHEKHDLILDSKPGAKSSKFPFPHHIVLDTNVILDQIDVLEEDILCNIIVMHTVLDEVKHKSSSVYKRLREIMGNQERKFYTFVNEHHKDTYVERKPGETSNDRNDRAIRVATDWYDLHLKGKKIRTVLMTDDVGNREKALASGILACSVLEYIQSLKNCGSLEDKLSKKNYESEGKKIDLFSPHLSPVQIHEGIKGGKLLQGAFQASRDNFLEGSVNVEGYEKFVSFILFF